MKKILSLLTLLLCIASGAWATDVLCSAQVPIGQEGTFSNTEGLTDGQTGCILYWSGLQAGSNTITVNHIDYYKLGSNSAYVQLKLTSGSFQEGDILTATVTSNGGSSTKEVNLKFGKSSNETGTVKVNSSETKDIVYTLKAEDIEDDGSIQLLRASKGSSNIRVAVFSVSGERSASEAFTVTFDAGSYGTCGTTSLTEEEPGAGITLPAVIANSGYAFNGWFTAATEGTKAGNAGSKYNPKANITLYAQYSAEVAPTIEIDNVSPSTTMGTAIKFTATATGTPTPTITWYQSETATNTGGTEKGTGTTYSPDVNVEGTFYYYAVASNGVSPDATSDVITLTVTDPNKYIDGNAYYVAKGEIAVPTEQIVCDDITMTFVNGKAGETLTAGTEDNHLSNVNDKYVAFIGGSNSNNGWGTEFVPTCNGVLSVGIIINNNKTFSITNATSFSYKGVNNASTPVEVEGTVDGNSMKTGESADDKLYVVVTIKVVAGTSYKFSVAGSKMSFYGFEFTPGDIATITTADYATFVPTMKVAVPDGVKAYYVTNINGNGKARMESVPVIPANKPVIIYKDVTEDTQVVFEATDAAEVILSNILNYSDAETVADGTQYILANGEDGVGFYKAKEESTIAARKAYLVSPVGANFLSFSFDGDATGIEKVENAAVNANGTMFNLAGQRVAQPTKGLYIVNGKKVVVK